MYLSDHTHQWYLYLTRSGSGATLGVPRRSPTALASEIFLCQHVRYPEWLRYPCLPAQTPASSCLEIWATGLGQSLSVHHEQSADPLFWNGHRVSSLPHLYSPHSSYSIDIFFLFTLPPIYRYTTWYLYADLAYCSLPAPCYLFGALVLTSYTPLCSFYVLARLNWWVNH